MSSGVRKIEKRSNQKSLQDRIAESEGTVARLIAGLEKEFTRTAEKANHQDIILNAMVELIGVQDVTETIQRQQLERAEAISAQEKATLEAGLAGGYTTPTDKVDYNTLWVGHETNAEGKPVGVGRQQLYLKNTNPQLVPLLVGKQAGDVIDLPNGGKLTLQELYKVDEELMQVVEQAKIMDAARAASEKDEQTDTVATPETAADQLDALI